MKLQLKPILVRTFILVGGLSLFAYFIHQFELAAAVPLLFFLMLVALIRLVDIELPQGDRVSLDSALLISALLLFSLRDALFIAIGGLLVSILIRQRTIDFGGPLFLVAERSLILVLAGLWLGGRYLLATAREDTLTFSGGDLFRVLALCLTFFLLELILEQVLLSLRKGMPFLPAFLGALKLLGQIYLALASIGVLTAMMYLSMGSYSLILFSIPLVVIRYSFKLFLDIKETYRHTIAALTRVIEVEDPHQRSHGERVSDISIEIGRELGFHGDRLEALGYAALLHDIGCLGLDSNSFDSYLDSQKSEKAPVPPHAVIGAEILEKVEFLRAIAPIVQKHHLPFEGSRRKDLEHPLESRIIAVATFYDQLTKGNPPEWRLSPNQAVAKIKKETIEFDPKVVRALINVLKRQEKLVFV